ncbi:MAG: type II secretion system protein GspC [Gammaproteobacteria bacterium]|nr:type II secretion system protein GspC [Gammaproteobacteria bacterium]
MKKNILKKYIFLKTLSIALLFFGLYQCYGIYEKLTVKSIPKVNIAVTPNANVAQANTYDFLFKRSNTSTLSQGGKNIQKITPEVLFPSIVLHGIIANSNPKKSLAIVSWENRQFLTSIGDNIGKTEAILTAISDTNITISLAGSEKDIPQVADQKIFNHQNPNKYSTIANTHRTRRNDYTVPKNNEQQSDITDVSSGLTIEKIRKELSTNPSKISRYVRFNPNFENGNMNGFRVSPGENQEIFKKIGLKNNDLITAISSADFKIDINNSQSMLDIWSKMKKADSFTFHVTRDNQQHEVNFSLK